MDNEKSRIWSLMKGETKDVVNRIPASVLLNKDNFLSSLTLPEFESCHQKQMAWFSMWSQWLFSKTLSPWIDALCCQKQVVPLWQFDWQIELAENGFPCGIDGKLPTYMAADYLMQRQAINQLIHGYLVPVCQLLAKIVNQKETLFWNNAAVYLYQSAKHLEEKGVNIQVVNELLTQHYWENGQKNRLAKPIIFIKRNDNCIILRRYCCLRFRLADYDKCYFCPLLIRLPKQSRYLSSD